MHAAATGRGSRTEHHSAIQDVAAGLAHELRNPVFSIGSAAQLLRYRVGDDPVIESNVGRILREVERLNALVSALLEYGRPAPLNMAEGNPDQAWEKAIAGQRGAMEGKGLKLERRGDHAARRHIDEEQLSHAFANFFTNAIEAAPPHSTLVLTTMPESDGGWRCVLTNAGAPIAADFLPHACDLLTTTKPGHAGIGLPVAQRIIAAHGGTVDLSSDASGTSVTVVLR